MQAEEGQEENIAFLQGPGPMLLEVVDTGNGLVWSRVGGRKMCEIGCEERKSWGLECSEDVEADGWFEGGFHRRRRSRLITEGGKFLSTGSG